MTLTSRKPEEHFTVGERNKKCDRLRRLRQMRGSDAREKEKMEKALNRTPGSDGGDRKPG